MKDLPRKIEITPNINTWPESLPIITLIQALTYKAITANREGYTVFVNFSGHINAIDLDIHPSGWRSQADGGSPRTGTTIYLDKEGAFEQLQAAIESIEVQS